MISERGWHRATTSSVVATTLAVWFLIGPLGEEGGTDYIVRIPQLRRPAEIVLGLIAAGVAVWSAVTVWPKRDLLTRAGWSKVYGRLLIVGVAVAVGGRIVTAGATGANIGGGGLLLIGPFPLFYLLERTRFALRDLTNQGNSERWTPSHLGSLLVGAELALGILLLWSLTPRRGG